MACEVAASPIGCGRSKAPGTSTPPCVLAAKHWPDADHWCQHRTALNISDHRHRPSWSRCVYARENAGKPKTLDRIFRPNTQEANDLLFRKVPPHVQPPSRCGLDSKSACHSKPEERRPVIYIMAGNPQIPMSRILPICTPNPPN